MKPHPTSLTIPTPKTTHTYTHTHPPTHPRPHTLTWHARSSGCLDAPQPHPRHAIHVRPHSTTPHGLRHAAAAAAHAHTHTPPPPPAPQRHASHRHAAHRHAAHRPAPHWHARHRHGHAATHLRHAIGHVHPPPPPPWHTAWHGGVRGHATAWTHHAWSSPHGHHAGAYCAHTRGHTCTYAKSEDVEGRVVCLKRCLLSSGVKHGLHPWALCRSPSAHTRGHTHVHSYPSSVMLSPPCVLCLLHSCCSLIGTEVPVFWNKGCCITSPCVFERLMLHQKSLCF